MAAPVTISRVGIALGSNLGDRLRHLQDARTLLEALAEPAEEFLQAPVYQTEPVGCPPGSPDFYNTVVELACRLSPLALLERTRAIERHLGRMLSTERNAPRVIDLDILYFGDEVRGDEPLLLPHPRLTRRRFVLQPLADIRPDLILPGDGATIAKHLRTLDPSEPAVRLVQSSW